MRLWQEIRWLVSAVIAMVSCPCHLPLTLPVLLSLTAGTVVGTWLAHNTPVIVGGSVVIFVSSLLLTLRWSRTSPQGCPTELNEKIAAHVQENQDSAWTQVKL